MDDQQRQRINGAAQEFTDALVAAYRTTSDGTAAAQQLGAQQIEYFFDTTVMNNLRTQAEGTLQITQQLATLQELAREATRKLTQVSTDNYMDFLDSVFSFYQGGAAELRWSVTLDCHFSDRLPPVSYLPLICNSVLLTSAALRIQPP